MANEPSVIREDTDFTSHGTRCAAWLYRDDEVDDPPIVVMANGYGLERSHRLPAYAERFADHGLAVLVFDYRYLGDSGGEPRQLMSPDEQLRDWMTAIDHARSLDGVDGDRLGLWGVSFSGGHVVAAAAEDGDVDALSALVPNSDLLRTNLYLARKAGIGQFVRSNLAAVRDLARGALGRDPYYVPIAAEPDEFAALNLPGTLAGYESVTGDDWDNRVAPRSFLTLGNYRPVTRADRVDCPTLVINGERDNIVPPSIVDRLVERLDDVERVSLPIGHFDVYTGETFETVVDKQVDFLTEHLLD